MTDVKSTVIITNAIKSKAKGLVNQLSDRADGMWETGLSASGNLPATHWISSGYMDGGILAVLASADLLIEAAYAKGVTVSKAEANTLLANVSFSDVDPYEFIDTLGLQIIRE